ncbi:hypothetical protein R3P38DRAFT_1118859 [Favolaschia claudopus]|uniref:F-box domain-containing protein n=1 Tax=Favolaschia claudopus TaxID=2862362 RepID=A0AAW0BA10_9AGAR
MTMVQQELRKQLDELSSAIEAQRLVLDHLINQRSHVQRQLNNFLDPMALLPLELQSKIFLECLCHAEEDVIVQRPDPKAAPMLLLGICQLWRDIALSTPELWNHLRMESSPARPNDPQFFEIWLKRSQSFPLALTLEGSSVLAKDVQGLVDGCGDRVETLTLLLTTIPTRGSHILREPFPSLEKLKIEFTDVRGFDIRDWMYLLKTSPTLTHLSFSGSFSVRETMADSTAPFTLPALRELHFPDYSPYSRVNATRILKYITLPALETLHIRCNANSENGSGELLDFLTRSSPPLRSLFINSSMWPSDIISSLEYLRIIPSLTDLSLVANDLISVLEMLPRAPDFLPNLRDLTCYPVSFLRPGDYEIVVRMLDVRPLKSFRLKMMDPSAAFGNAAPSWDPTPSEDIIRELRRSRDSGVSVHVSAGEQIFV